MICILFPSLRLQNLAEARNTLNSFNQLTKPYLEQTLQNLQAHASKIREMNSRLSSVYTALRKMRKDLTSVGISFPDEEDPVEAIERRANEELERRKNEMYERKLRERAALAAQAQEKAQTQETIEKNTQPQMIEETTTSGAQVSKSDENNAKDGDTRAQMNID